VHRRLREPLESRCRAGAASTGAPPTTTANAAAASSRLRGGADGARLAGKASWTNGRRDSDTRRQPLPPASSRRKDTPRAGLGAVVGAAAAVACSTQPAPTPVRGLPSSTPPPGAMAGERQWQNTCPPRLRQWLGPRKGRSGRGGEGRSGRGGGVCGSCGQLAEIRVHMVVT
jgi:hypothetical protein